MKTKILMALAGIVLFAACKGNYDRRSSESSDSTSIAQEKAIADKPKLVKNAGISFKVNNARQTGDSIANLTAKYNGLVMHHQLSSEVMHSEKIFLSNDSIRQVSVINTVADMTVRVPSERLEEFINQVGRMTLHIDSMRMNVEDKSADYLSSQLKAKNRKDWVLQKKDEGEAKNADAILAMKDNVVDNQINNVKTDAAVKYSTVVLSFYQNSTVDNEVLANDDPSAYHAPFFNRLGMALANGWYVFADIIFALANLWVFILAGVGAWFLFRLYKRKHPAIKL
ncbi:DUF4349 domain-containing protein [Inquilinus sp. KBS0705]|nr:DUF4349 domain-containing protein [Inquilinus sp. KBS0705]